jgi:CO/xanthine dehydrogenase Mo-binding subunit
MNRHYVGKRIPRIDGLEKVTGRAVYGFDVALPGMLYGGASRSPWAHARIAGIDVSAAKNLPGIRAVVTGKDFPYTFGGSIQDQPFLAIDRVRYVGEPVVAVAGDTETAVQEALGKIRVRYEELPAVFDPREAMKEGAPLLHPDLEKGEPCDRPRHERLHAAHLLSG